MSQPSIDCFADDQLNRFLDDLLEDHEKSALLDHLDKCASCASRLDGLAADAEFWQWSADSLRSTTDWQECDENQGNRLSPVLAAMFGPTENPYSLGRIGRFEIVGVVGSGGMGIVLKARDVDIDRIVALKLPAAHLMELPSALERIEREARSAATIRHPGIIEIYQVDRWRGIPYLVMPFHTGPSLTARIESDGQLELLESIRVARQTAEALAAAHDHGVVHRDVKPGNILLGQGTERAVLTDFGIAKIQSDVEMTATGVIVGTPAFLSPEQAAGGNVTSQSDIFSLGTVIWSMLAGRPPFVNLPTHTVVAAIASGKMPALSQYRSDLPAWVYRLIEWMHAEDPNNRPESALQCAELLRECEQHLLDPVHHRLPEIAGVRSRKRFRLSVACTLICAVIACAAIISTNRRWTNDSGTNRSETANDNPSNEAIAMPVESLPIASTEVTQSATEVSINELNESVDELDQELASVLAELDKLATELTPEMKQTSESEE